MRILQAVLGGVLVLTSASCSRSAIEAVNLTNEGDKVRGTNVEELRRGAAAEEHPLAVVVGGSEWKQYGRMGETVVRAIRD